MKKAEKKMLVWCGPDIRGVAKQFSVFTEGLPEQLEQLRQEKPLIGGLIVPVRDVAEARRAVQTEGTALYNIFVKAKEELEKGE